MTEERFYLSDSSGIRLDVFLVNVCKNYSRSHLQKLIEQGFVHVDDRIVKSNYKLSKGENVRLEIPEPREIEVNAEKIPLNILYEDRDIIVINKARGMVVHPAAGVSTGTLVNALLEHCKDLSGINGAVRPGIVHRLDKDTSGVMVVAKNDNAHIALAEQIKSKTARRIYWTIVHGNIKVDEGKIEGNIARHPVDRKRMAVVSTGGKTAITNFRVLERFGAYTLVECKLETGRTHQIRVHLTKLGFPIVGDAKYGSGKSPWKIAGQALHSLELTLFHPVRGDEMVFKAPLPSDMEIILKNLYQKTGRGESYYENIHR